MTTLDYAAFYENEYRVSRRMRRMAARVVWGLLFIVRPQLAMGILRDR